MSASLEYIEVNDTKIPLIHEKDTTLPIRSMQLVFVGGGALFSEKEGLSRFSAKILSQGTKSLGASAYANELEKYAISLNVNNGNETFVVELTSLKEYFDKGLKLGKQLFLNPNLSDEAVKKVKTNFTGQLLQQESNYDYLASRELKGLIYEKPLANYTTPNNVEQITKEDVQEFLNQKLSLENIIVLTGGDYDLHEAKDDINDFLSIFNKGERYELPYFKPNDKTEKKVTIKESDQAYIYFIAPLGQVKKEDLHLSKLASFILGSSGFGSRLMEEIRVKRGLAYSVYARYVNNKTHSYFTGHLQTKIDSQEEAIEVIESEIKKFIDEGVKQKELKDAKKFLLGSDPLRRETLMQRISIAFNEYYRGLELGYGKKELDKIKEVDLEQLNKFIKDHAQIQNLSYSIVTAR